MISIEALEVDDKWPGTPVPYLLSTNNPPSEDERTKILAVIEEYEREIQCLDTEMEHVRDFLQKAGQVVSAIADELENMGRLETGKWTEAQLMSMLQEERRNQEILLSVTEASRKCVQFSNTINTQLLTLLKVQVEHKHTLSYIRLLPPEVLAEIFLFTRPVRSFHTRHTSKISVENKPHDLQFAFSQVCSYWRQISLNTAALWSDIPTVQEEYRGDRVRGYHHLICAFLERSKNHSINVVVAMTHNYGFDNHLEYLDGSQIHGASFPLILSVLLSSVHRWRTAVLLLAVDTFHNLPSHDFPLLEKLNMRASCRGDNYWPFPRKFFGATPKLKHVVGDGLYLCPEEEEPDADDTAPRALMVGVEQFVGFPKSSIDLQLGLLTLTACTFRGPLSQTFLHPEDKLVFPQLRYLCVANTNYQHPLTFGRDDHTIFQCMETPVLETLIVHGHPKIDEADSIISHIVDHTLVSPAPLQRLVLHIAGISRENLKMVLRAVPLLKELDMHDMIWAEDKWRDMIFQGVPGLDNAQERPQISSLVPALRSLIIRKGRLVGLGELHAVYRSRRLVSVDSITTRAPSGFSIVFEFFNYSLVQYALSCTEGWNDKSVEEWRRPGSGSEHSKMNGWTTFIMKQLVARKNPSKRKLKIRGTKIRPTYFATYRRSAEASEQLNTVFEIVEKHEVQDPRLLEITGLIHAVEQLARLPPKRIWKNESYNFKDRAQALSGRWNALLYVRKALMPLGWTLLEDGLTMVLPGRGDFSNWNEKMLEQVVPSFNSNIYGYLDR